VYVSMPEPSSWATTHWVCLSVTKSRRLLALRISNAWHFGSACVLLAHVFNHHPPSVHMPCLFIPADDELLQQYGMSVTLAVCEAYNEVQRIKEELALLPREMEAHLQYWQAVVDKQDRLIAMLLTPPPATAGDVEAAVQQLHSIGFKVSM